MKIKHVEGEAPTPWIVLQKPDLKIKVKHVEEQVDIHKPNLKVKVEHVEEQINLQKPYSNNKVKGTETYIID